MRVGKLLKEDMVQVKQFQGKVMSGPYIADHTASYLSGVNLKNTEYTGPQLPSKLASPLTCTPFKDCLGIQTLIIFMAGPGPCPGTGEIEVQINFFLSFLGGEYTF